MQRFLCFCVLLFILNFVRTDGAAINFNTSLVQNGNNFNLMDPTIYNGGVLPGPLDTVNIFSGTGFSMISFYVPANASFVIGELLVNGTSFSVNLYGNLTIQADGQLATVTSYDLTSFLNIFQNSVFTVYGNFWLSVHMRLTNGGIFQQTSSSLSYFLADQYSGISIEAQSSFYTNALAFFTDCTTYKVSNSNFTSSRSTVVQGGSFLVANSDMFLGELIIENTTFADFNVFDAYSVTLVSSTVTFSVIPSDHLEFISVDSNSTWILTQSTAVIGSPDSAENPIQGNGVIQITSSSLTLYNLNYLSCAIQFSGPNNAFTYYAGSNFAPDESLFNFTTPDAFVTFTQMSGNSNLAGNWSIFGNWILQGGSLGINGSLYLQNSSALPEDANMISGLVFVAQSNSGTHTLLGFQNITIGEGASLTVNSPSEVVGNIYNFGTMALSVENVLQLTGDLQLYAISTLFIYDYVSPDADSIPLDVSGSANIEGTLNFFAPKISKKTSYVVLTTNSLVGKFSKTSNVNLALAKHVKFDLVYASGEVDVLFSPTKGHHGVRWWGYILIFLSIGIVGAGVYVLVRRWTSQRHRFVLIE